MKYQVIIIGGGPAGYTAAETAGKGGLSVLLIEKNSLGGVCLNEGCIPTKTLLYSAKTYDSAKHASKYAVNIPEVSFDLPKIIARKSKVVRKLVLGVRAKLTANHVTIVSGEAQIIDKNTVRCGEETYEGENLILCTGSETFIPPIPGTDTVPFWTHRDALDSKELPASLAIIGGGVIGMEFASFSIAWACRSLSLRCLMRFLEAWIKNCPPCCVPNMPNGVSSSCWVLRWYPLPKSLAKRRKNRCKSIMRMPEKSVPYLLTGFC